MGHVTEPARLVGTVSISRVQKSVDMSDVIVLRVRCDRSNTRIVEVEMDPGDFMLAVTGRGDMRGIITGWDYDKAVNVGKYKIVSDLYIDPPGSYRREDVAKYVRSHPLVMFKIKEGWELECDGTLTKQSGGKHMVTMRKYVEDGP